MNNMQSYFIDQGKFGGLVDDLSQLAASSVRCGLLLGGFGDACTINSQYRYKFYVFLVEVVRPGAVMSIEVSQEQLAVVVVGVAVKQQFLRFVFMIYIYVVDI